MQIVPPPGFKDDPERFPKSKDLDDMMDHFENALTEGRLSTFELTSNPASATPGNQPYP